MSIDWISNFFAKHEKEAAQLKIKMKEKKNMKLKVNEMRKLNIMSRVKRANEWTKISSKLLKGMTCTRNVRRLMVSTIRAQFDVGILLNETIAIEIWTAVAECTHIVHILFRIHWICAWTKGNEMREPYLKWAVNFKRNNFITQFLLLLLLSSCIIDSFQMTCWHCCLTSFLAII